MITKSGTHYYDDPNKEVSCHGKSLHSFVDDFSRKLISQS